jgi:hypothetical protein
MSIAHVRKAFHEAGTGKFACTKARLRYVREGGKEYQVLEFDGFNHDGTPFTVTSDKIQAQGDLHAAAKTTAANHIKQYAAQPRGDT